MINRIYKIGGLFVALCLSMGSEVVQATCFCTVDSFASTAQLHVTSGPAVYLVCPAGDTGTFSEQGFTVSIQLLSPGGLIPVVGWPASDVEARACEGTATPTTCAGNAANPDQDSDANGFTEMAETKLVGGGCADGFDIWVRCDLPPFNFHALKDSVAETYCLAVFIRSPDLNGDNSVNLIDLAAFAQAYEPAGGQYETCSDFDLDGELNLIDLSTFAAHYGPPNHACP